MNRAVGKSIGFTRGHACNWRTCQNSAGIGHCDVAECDVASVLDCEAV